MPEAEDPPRLCPSALARPGAALIGVVQADGTVALLGRPLPATAAFLAEARRGREPERRFRFAAPCVEAECRQWTGGRCGVIDRVVGPSAPRRTPGPAAPAPAASGGVAAGTSRSAPPPARAAAS